MHDPDGALVNPYASLQAAQRIDSPVAEADPSPIPRLAGIDRVATAIAVAEEGWPDGSATAVLAAGDLYAEALPAAALAGARRAPLLLETGSTLSDDVDAEIDRLGADQVIVVGSVAAAIDDELRAGGRSVTRLGVSGDAVRTAADLAAAIGGNAGVAVLVNRSRFADGVSAAAVAAAHGWPVLLADTSLVPQVTVDAWRALGVGRLVLVGGTAVLGQNIEDFIRDRGRCAGQSGCAVERVAGADRYGTSVASVERSVAAGGTSVASLLLGTGTNYPDTLASGPLAARTGGVTLLVDGSGQRHDAASRAFLSTNAAAVDAVAILGGPGAVTSAADRAIQEALGLA
jgi:putative cell wall-binding protein